MNETKTFNYKGYTFKPVGNIIGGWVERVNHSTLDYALEIEGYTHEDFYKVARKHKASVDVFEVNGELYIPGNTKLFSICGNPKIKAINEYKRWYK